MERHSARRFAATMFVLALLTVLFSVFVALVYRGDLDMGRDFVATFEFGSWIAGFTVVLAFFLVMLLIVFLMPVTTTEPQPEPTYPPEDASTVICAQCGEKFLLADTGERPLLYACPHCGHEAQLTDGLAATAAPETVAEAEPATATPAGPRVVERMEGGISHKYLVLNCGNCNTNFETEYTEQRPLVTTCTNCGRRGILR